MELYANFNMGRGKLFGNTYFEQDYKILNQESYFEMFKPMCDWYVYISAWYQYTMSTMLSKVSKEDSCRSRHCRRIFPSSTE